MAEYYLTQTGDQVQEELNQVMPNKDAIANEVQARIDGDAAVTQHCDEAVAAENDRATETEQTLQGKINDEATRAKAVEQMLQGNIDDEATRAKAVEQTLQGNIDNEATRAQDAEGTLQDNIDAEETRAKAAEKANADDIDAIEEKIPSSASSANKLATEDYVNDKVATDSSTFRGTFNLVSDLGLVPTATHSQIAYSLGGEISTANNNDYAFVQIPTSVETPTEIVKIERYKFNGEAWAFEYDLNNSGFTASQWSAINSGITSNDVTKLAALPTNAELTTLLNGKQDTLTIDNVPTRGSNNPVKSGGVYSANKTLSDAIEAILLLIPSAATSLNQLADKAFVNSSIATASATFRGTFNSVSDLHLSTSATHEQIGTVLAASIATADNNDYCFVQIPTSMHRPTEIARTERYKFNGTSWEYEYTLNNSGYTTAQWNAINSGITEELVAKLSALPTNADLNEALGVLTDGIAAINEKIPSGASSENKLTTQSDVEAVASNLQDQINEIVGGGATVSLTASPTTIFVGQQYSIALTASTNKNATSIIIKKADTQIASGSGSSLQKTDSVTADAAGSISYSAEFIISGVTRTANRNITAVYPIYFGAGMDQEDVLGVDACKATARTTPNGTYNVTVADSPKYIWFFVPSDMPQITSAKMNGFDFPLEAQPDATEGDTTYKVYRTPNTQEAGTYPIIINPS